MSDLGSRDHQEPRGARVYTMHDAWALWRANRRESPKMMQQSIHKCAIRMPRSGVNHQAGGLLHHRQVFILEDDVDLDVLRRQL